MHEAQGGLCAICKQPETGKHNRGSKEAALELAVDHCHITGDVRQLLCHKCNKALGLFQDDPNILKAATEYLERHGG